MGIWLSESVVKPFVWWGCYDVVFFPASAPRLFVLKENGTQSYSAKFLNWGDHVNSVPDLAASPPTSDFVQFLTSPDVRIRKYSSMFGFPWKNPYRGILNGIPKK